MVVALTVTVLVAGAAFCGISWSFAQDDLGSAREFISSMQAALESRENELSVAREELLISENKLQYTSDCLSSAEAELQVTKERLLSIEVELQAFQARPATQPNEYSLHNPSLGEVTSFLAEDETNFNQYVEDEYICSHFVRDVSDNAESQGLRCACVIIYFADRAHALIAFDTIDEDVVYFDAVTDERVIPVVGEKYWQCIETGQGYHYEKPAYDDTIEDIVVISGKRRSSLPTVLEVRTGEQY
ncbi:hypothetical protein ACFLV3_02975 [Chloroflexota bacterium]